MEKLSTKDYINNIIVCNNFLTNEELSTGLDIIHNGTWKYGHKSNQEKLYNNVFWQMDLTNNDFFSKELFSIIEKHFSKKFELLRVYANGHTYGQDGEFHIDSDSEKDYTFCLYLTKIDEEYVETAGGYLYFNVPNEKYKICFEPIFNSGIFFPSNYIHKGVSYSRYIMNIRISIAWKLRIIN